MFPFIKKEWSKSEWGQLKNLTPKDLITLLKKDTRWELVKTKGSRYIFYNVKLETPYQYLEIHHHKKGYRNKGLLKSILDQWCCTKNDFKKWNVIK
ncbi:MAG: type II toxin-antitoxin system HicA family toxin [Candidatus Ratteibacteria bacterium]